MLFIENFINQLSALTLAILLINSKGIAQTSCLSLFKEKSVSTLPVKNTLDIEAMNKGRGIKEYSDELDYSKQDFLRLLLEVPEDGVILDVGTGQGRFSKEIIEMYSSMGLPHPHIVGLDYKKPSNFLLPEKAHNFELRHGSLLEDMFQNGALDDIRGKVVRIFDVFSAASYSRDLGKVIAIYFNLLKMGGTIELNIPLYDITKYNNIYHYLNIEFEKNLTIEGVHFKKSDSIEKVLISWLSLVNGITVERQEITGMNVTSMALKIRKTGNTLSLPELEPTEYIQKYPPIRKYILHNTFLDPAQ